MRKLIYIAMIHDTRQTDPEGYAKFLSKLSTRGKRVESCLNDTILPRFWRDVEEYVKQFEFDKMYMEGLTWMSDDFEFTVRTYAERGDALSQIVLDLYHKGVTPVQTEDLFVHEFCTEIQRESIIPEQQPPLPADLPVEIVLSAIKDDVSYQEYEYFAKLCEGEAVIDPIKIRDKDIASRVSKDLKNDETGILFLGSRHNANKILGTIDPEMEIQVYKTQDSLSHLVLEKLR